MSIEYYAFALFIAGLVCFVAVICKVLFSDVKRQRKLLDERETQILQLYTRIETIMEEFDDQVKAVMTELKEYEYRATKNITAFDLPPELEKKEQVLEKLPRTVPFEANRIKVAGEVLERAERIIKNDAVIGNSVDVTVDAGPHEKENSGAVFQKFFDETAEATPPPAATKTTNAQTRSEAILSLADEGKNDVEIASELGITRNEVQLVIGLTR